MTKVKQIRFYYFPSEFVQLMKRTKGEYKESIKIQDKGTTQMVAHRGLSGVYRENTLSAFEAAATASYYGIETDVHITSDGEFVIIHDDTTGRVADTDISVENSTLETLRGVHIQAKNGDESEKGTRIPTLIEYVLACKAGGKVGVLELKNHFEPKDIYRIIEQIESVDYLDKMIFISFDLPNCVAIRQKYPNLPVQFLTTRYDSELIRILVTNKLDLDIYYRELNGKRIKALHDAGIKVNCWTVDTVNFARKLINWGVDYITSNILE